MVYGSVVNIQTVPSDRGGRLIRRCFQTGKKCRRTTFFLQHHFGPLHVVQAWLPPPMPLALVKKSHCSSSGAFIEFTLGILSKGEMDYWSDEVLFNDSNAQ
ncbi:hypothetical protein WG66_002054 [Moniliophthora roreri]|nr:hypothetical protein WG66_002054 [Moniliophthora roreri]